MLHERLAVPSLTPHPPLHGGLFSFGALVQGQISLHGGRQERHEHDPVLQLGLELGLRGDPAGAPVDGPHGAEL